MAMISFIVFAIFFTFVSSNSENDIVRITNSGSTNTAGYVIELQRDGLVKWTVASRSRPLLSTTPSGTTAQNNIQLSAARTKAIFEAIEQAFPFTQYASVSCAKSVSFGTTLHVTYNGQQTPDLNCPVKGERLVVLSKDIHELITDLNINTFG